MIFKAPSPNIIELGCFFSVIVAPLKVEVVNSSSNFLRQIQGKKACFGFNGDPTPCKFGQAVIFWVAYHNVGPYERYKVGPIYNCWQGPTLHLLTRNHGLNFKRFSELWNNLPTPAPPPPPRRKIKQTKNCHRTSSPEKNMIFAPGKGDEPKQTWKVWSPTTVSSQAAMSCGNFPMKGQRHVICHWLWTSLCWSSK